MIRERFRALLVPATALALGACTALGSDRSTEETAGLDPGSPCPRPEPVAHSPGSVITLTEAPTPCRIVFRETGTVLRSDPDGSHPDPGRNIVRDSKGRFYTSGASGFPFDIAMWDSDGTFLRSFGGQGDGPGEMGSEGGLFLQIDSRDRLHVKDARRVWTTFDADQTFIRRVSSRGLGEAAFLGGFDRILDDGGAVAGGGYLFTESTFHFQRVDSTGEVVSQFSPKDPVVYESFRNTSRTIAYGGGDTFWAGPPTYNGYSPDGYTLEEWTVDGELLRTFRREVPWLPTNWPPPPPPIDHRPVEEKPNPPSITRLHMDDDGVLLVVVLSPTDRWVDIPEMMALPEEEQALTYETRIEAIDTRAGVVLASELLVGMERNQLGTLLTRSRFSATMSEEKLLPVVRILEYDLVTQ